MNVNVFLNPGVKRIEFPLKTGHFPGLKLYISIPVLTIGTEGGQSKLNGYTPEITSLRATHPEQITQQCTVGENK